MKFLHTADWQVGMKAAHAGGAGKRVREQRLQTAREVVEIAHTQGAEFMLLAGDTFEDNMVDRSLIQRVAGILGTFNGAVYIIPGNHDPAIPGSVWDHPCWQGYANIRIIREAVPIELFGGTLYPCPVLDKYSNSDPTAWIPPNREAGIRIGMAHGTVEGIHQEEPELPIPRDAAKQRGLDYLALGHWHSYTPYSDAGNIRMAYSGTHETTRFGERDSGKVLIVEIPGAGEAPRILEVPTSGLTWSQRRLSLRHPGELLKLREELERSAKPQETLLEVHLEGMLSFEDQEELESLQSFVEAHFAFGRVRTDLRLLPTGLEWIDELPKGIPQQAALHLKELANPTGSPADSSPEIALQALRLLYTFSREVHQ